MGRNVGRKLTGLWFGDIISVITPDRETGDVIVRGNEILVGERRLVFQLAGTTQTCDAPLAV